VIFALALLSAGQSASLVATVGGQIVSEGFLRWRVSVGTSPYNPHSPILTYPCSASRAAPPHAADQLDPLRSSCRGSRTQGYQHDACRVTSRPLHRVAVRHLPARLAHLIAQRDASAPPSFHRKHGTGEERRHRRAADRRDERVSGFQQWMGGRGNRLFHLLSRPGCKLLCTYYSYAWRGELGGALSTPT
jgi:hypothetical protein